MKFGNEVMTSFLWVIMHLSFSSLGLQPLGILGTLHFSGCEVIHTSLPLGLRVNVKSGPMGLFKVLHSQKIIISYKRKPGSSNMYIFFFGEAQ